MPPQALIGPIEAMGQALFAPPNVKGWPGGSSWLNTSTVLERDNFAEALAMGTLWHPASSEPAGRVTTASQSHGPVVREIVRLMGTRNTPEEPAPPRAFDPARLLQEEGVSRHEDIVRSLLDLYLPGAARPDVPAKLVAFMARGKPAGAALDRRVREAVHAILTMAEYQLA
jgi:hypothetical protein